MASEYFDIVDAIKKHLVKAVYRTKPSHAKKEMAKWRAYTEGEDLNDAVGKGSRVFQIKESEDAPELVFSGSGVDDYDVTVEIDVCYPDDNRIDTVARGDYTKIKGEVMGSTNIELIDLGFGCFTFQDSILDDADDEEYRILTIPIVCRISVGKTSTIEQWNIGADGIDVRFV